jgi:hypothetical protein
MCVLDAAQLLAVINSPDTRKSSPSTIERKENHELPEILAARMYITSVRFFL